MTRVYLYLLNYLELFSVSIKFLYIPRWLRRSQPTLIPLPHSIPVVVLKNCEPELAIHHISLVFQYVCEKMLFSKLLQSLTCGPCTKDSLKKVYNLVFSLG